VGKSHPREPIPWKDHRSAKIPTEAMVGELRYLRVPSGVSRAVIPSVHEILHQPGGCRRRRLSGTHLLQPWPLVDVSRATLAWQRWSAGADSADVCFGPHDYARTVAAVTDASWCRNNEPRQCLPRRVMAVSGTAARSSLGSAF